jgi:hypothetical protein
MEFLDRLFEPITFPPHNCNTKIDTAGRKYTLKKAGII